MSRRGRVRFVAAVSLMCLVVAVVVQAIEWGPTWGGEGELDPPVITSPGEGDVYLPSETVVFECVPQEDLDWWHDEGQTPDFGWEAGGPGNVSFSPSANVKVGFRCNEVQVIGSSVWAVPFPSRGQGFNYHEVAWTGSAGAGDNVYDACLKVDGEGNPTFAPRTGELPTGETFSDGLQTSPYVCREKLAAPGALGYDMCTPRPDRKWRPVCR